MRLAASVRSGAMPGISPAKIAFQPSRNWASVMPMPSEERKALTELLAKYKSNRREEDDDE